MACEMAKTVAEVLAAKWQCVSRYRCYVTWTAESLANSYTDRTADYCSGPARRAAPRTCILWHYKLSEVNSS